MSEPKTTHDVRTIVREKYGEIAEGKRGGCGCGSATDAGSGCCGGSEDVMTQIGYSKADAATIPEGADLGLGCGNPIAHAAIRPGETVLDLGSGAGIDCFLAARDAGPEGRVIGVDMTPAMLDKARANAVKAGTTTVEFRLGEIEHLPVADASVDVVISNCVINLSPDKPRVFREALRVLRSGGRAVVSDLVLLRPITAEAQRNMDLYVGCVAGALLKDAYIQAMRDAGFRDVTVLEERRYTVGSELLPEGSDARDAFDAVVSVKVRGVKP